MNEKKIEEKMGNLITELNPKWQQDPDMTDTPQRIAKLYAHFFRNESPEKHFQKKFPTDNSRLVVVKNIECCGTCPHHFLPVIYKIHIGYEPNGWVLGLSKFNRIASALSSYPKLQENFTLELVNALYKNLHPKSVIVVIKGIHVCMVSRGIEKKNKVITSSIHGNISKKTLTQFYSLLKL